MGPWISPLLGQFAYQWGDIDDRPDRIEPLLEYGKEADKLFKVVMLMGRRIRPRKAGPRRRGMVLDLLIPMKALGRRRYPLQRMGPKATRPSF
ncbi:hypothetical protein DL765_011570 [Monosporascus sp. GIB2]|nr:hypothetical protein DL765_011570 [Monosporascus sp. GIB2]